jgi:hypothetical protein
VDYFALGLALLFVWWSVSAAFGSGADGPTWQLRWQSLGPDEQRRISVAARSNVSFDDPGEADLAAGLTRRTRRRQAHIELVAVPFVLGFAALALLGTLSPATFGFVASMALPFTVWVAPWLARQREPLAE